MTDEKQHSAGRVWVGYSFAAVLSLAIAVLRFEVGNLTGLWLSVPLCGLAAVIASVWWVGTGPAFTAALLTTAWYVWDSKDVAAGDPRLGIHFAMYLIETAIICISGHQVRLARDRASRGEDWQRHLVQTAGEGIWMVDPSGVISYANPRMAEMVGCPIDRIVGRKVDEFFFPEDQPMERIRFQNRQNGVREQFDRRIRRPDGSELWTLACSSPYSFTPRDSGVLTMMTDITERKKAEQALRSSERKFRELFENIREGVYQTAPDGRILAANPELLRMMGFNSPDELNVPGVVRDTFIDLDVHRNLRERLERDGSYANVEFQLRTRDGRLITVRENARVVRDESGRVIYYEGTLTDLTDSLRAEKQLRQEQKMEALSALAAGIGQDLGAIGTELSETLAKVSATVPDGGDAPRGLAAISASAASLSNLARGLLNFSQTRGASPEPYDVNDFLRAIADRLRPLLEPELSLTLSLCNESAPVTVDSAVVEQLIAGSLQQARAEAPSGSGKVELATAIEARGPAAGARPSVAIVVPGASGPASTNSIRATMQAILSQYGGTITTGRDPASFTLHLPLSGNLAAGKPARPAGVAQPSGSATVLLVEEDPLFRELSRDMLERQGYRVLIAGTAQEAERIARAAEAFDVLMVEDRQGNELLATLRTLRPATRALFVIAHSEPQDGATSPKAGVATLQKPFSAAALGATIRELSNR